MNNTMPPTICVGVDVTWWGGSTRNRASRRETIVAIRLGAQSSLGIELVDLSPVPNPVASDATEANYDRNGKYLVDAILRTIERTATGVEKVIIALDAPLEACARPGQPIRRKAVAKGESMGSVRRECEQALARHMQDLPTDVRRGWNRDLKILSGSPVAPRIANVLELLEEHNYEIVRHAEQEPSRAIIEIFPSEAIWSLGVLGHYAELTSQEVRAYKSKDKATKTMSNCVARDVASRPLAGFAGVLCPDDGLDSSVVASWIDTLVDNAVACSPGKTAGEVDKGKGFDDPIDSGIAALTCVAHALGRYHIFGDGSDGTIVGPGRFGQ